MGQVIKSVCVSALLCMYVCMYVSVDTPTVAFLTTLYEIWKEPLGSEYRKNWYIGLGRNPKMSSLNNLRMKTLKPID